MQINDVDKETLIQQWQTCVDMANSISQRRDTMNNLFVTLNLAVVATITIVWDLKSMLISCVGIVICCVWWRFITYFKHLNQAKFFVISELEQNMKIKPFTVESPIAHYYRSVLGFIVFKTAAFFMVLFTRDKMQKKMLKKVIPYQPLRSLQTTTKLTKENLEGIVDIMNFHPIRGLRKLCYRKKK